MPMLARMTLDIFAISAMSSESKRVFLGAKRTLYDRASINSKTLETTQCMKYWLWASIYTRENIIAAIADDVEDANDF